MKFIRKEFAEIENYSFVNLNIINNNSLIYKINGKDRSLKPYLLAAHYDVVPAPIEKWTHHPFSATIQDGFVYARGSLDDKSSMMSQLESVKFFLKSNGQPNRTIYLAYGHDEEISGVSGAKNIAKYLGNDSLEFVLDEGLLIVEDIFPELEKSIAYIGFAEKGYLNVKFYANTTGGHSSMPKDSDSAILLITDAINKLKNKKSPSMLGYGPESEVLKKLAVNFGFIKRVILSNIWIFRPLVEFLFSKTPATDAMQRTTTAVTLINGGIKENVIPAYAEFVVNHRIHSLQSCSEIVNYDLSVINDERIHYEILGCEEPSKISPITSVAYNLIEHTTMQIYPEVSIVPGVVVGLTDSRFYSNLTNNIYRYLPIKIKNDELRRYHGIDERLSIKNYENMINFYYLLFKNTDQIHLNTDEKSHNEL